MKKINKLSKTNKFTLRNIQTSKKANFCLLINSKNQKINLRNKTNKIKQPDILPIPQISQQVTNPQININHITSTHLGVLSGACAANSENICMNKLIKKITLNFHTNKHDANFVIKHGIFLGSEFFLHSRNNLLDIKIKHMPPGAKKILKKNQNKLAFALKQKNIELENIDYQS